MDLSRISIICFAASYAIALVMDCMRLFSRVKLRATWALIPVCAGLLAHVLYIFFLVRDSSSGVTPMPSWYHWCLVSAWVLAAIYLGLALSHKDSAIGVFLLPLVLAIIGLAHLRGPAPFAADESYNVWLLIHGISLLMGTVVLSLGFAAGVMYLVQAYRIKHKMPPRRGFSLPSLEWLQRINGHAMIVSTCLLAAGFMVGIFVNISDESVPWSDPVIWTSAGLLLWLVAESLFELFYKPARQGKKIAYLTVASFLFLALVLGVVLFFPNDHAAEMGTRANSDRSIIEKITFSDRVYKPVDFSATFWPEVVR